MHFFFIKYSICDHYVLLPFRVYLTIILINVSNHFNAKKIIIQVLKKRETFSKIIIKYTLNNINIIFDNLKCYL